MKLQLNRFFAQAEFIKDDGKVAHLTAKIIEKKNRLEEQLIMKILEDILKRKPTIEDAKKCTKKILPNTINYIFGYNGIDLGTVTFESNPSKNIPFEHSELLLIRFKPLQDEIMDLNNLVS